MGRNELIAIGNRIRNSEGTEAELHELINLFDKNVPHPNGSALFFYPENYDFRKGGISNYNPSTEEVVDKCLSCFNN